MRALRHPIHVRRPNARDLFWMAAILFLVASCSGVYWFLTNGLAVAYQQANAANRNMVVSLARDLRLRLETIDRRLVAVRDGMPGPLEGTLSLDGGTRDEFAPCITMIDSRGDRGTASSCQHGPANLADQPYFRHHLANTDPGLLLTGPFISDWTGQPTLAFTRRLASREGRFAGVVLASVPLKLVRDLFADLHMGRRGMLLLATQDGQFLVSHPADDIAAGEDISRDRLFRELARSPDGAYRAAGGLDGIDRLFVYDRIQGFPLVLAAGTASRDIYDQWLGKAVIGCGIFLFILSASAILGLELKREFRRREHAERVARDSERKAQSSETYARQLMNNVGDLILHVDWSGQQLFVSPACRQILGRAPDELIGRPIFVHVHPEDAALVRKTLSRLESALPISPVSYRLLHHDGIWRYVEARGQPLPDRSGTIIVVRDVTERMALEAKLRQAHRMEALGQLTAGVSHDFNNMLQAQLGTLELLMDGLPHDPASLKLASKAFELGEKGARLTSQLLSFSRRQMLMPQAIPTQSFLLEFGEIVRRTVGPAIQVQVRVPDDIPALFADTANLESALMNLALNARDAMPGGGTLGIWATGRSRQMAAGAGSVPLGYVTVGVRDSGVGMDSATLTRACEPFFTTKGVKGTGLGLASVQGFAEQSGGTLTIVSSPGQGTSIELHLPSGSDPDVARERPSPIQGEGGRILLVDDQQEVLDSIGMLLKEAGFDVVAALGPHQALQAVLDQAPFDCLITDYLMPGLDGAALVRAVHAHCPGIPALLITGWTNSEEIDALSDFTAVLRKPFTREILVQHVSQMVAGSRVQALQSTLI